MTGGEKSIARVSSSVLRPKIYNGRTLLFDYHQATRVVFWGLAPVPIYWDSKIKSGDLHFLAIQLPLEMGLQMSLYMSDVLAD